MCVEDVVISRGTYIKSTTIDANGVVDLKANVDRIAVSVSTHGFTNTRTIISLGAGTAGSSTGIQVSSAIGGAGTDKIGETNILLNYRDYPGIVQGEISVHCVTTAGTVHEHIMTPDLARAVRRAEDKLLHGG